MTTVPTTPETIREAFQQDLLTLADEGIYLEPGEWESIEAGTPVIRVTVRSASSSGRYLSAIVQAGFETSMGDYEAGPMLRFEFKTYDGRLSREKNAERFFRWRGLHKVAEVPVRYERRGF